MTLMIVLFLLASASTTAILWCAWAIDDAERAVTAHCAATERDVLWLRGEPYVPLQAGMKLVEPMRWTMKVPR